MSLIRKKRILINCSNLHVGGGVAVATSFIDSLSRMEVKRFDFYMLLSSSVSHNLKILGTDLSVFYRCEVVDYFGVSAFWSGLDKYFRYVDLVFTVFGPAYFLFSRVPHVFGFAQPNIIYPVNPISINMNLIDRLKFRIKYKLQEYFFSRADLLVVELEHVKLGLEKIPMFKGKRVCVVNSSVHSVFKDSSKWLDVYIPKFEGALRLGVVSRNYPHKNLSILPSVKFNLYSRYGLKVNFYVTFQSEEWLSCDEGFKREIINVGGLSLSQCPVFYSSLDGVIFPSLLECFSAVPIEAMVLKRPLFASDLPFIRDVCDEHCNYFDPLDVESIASSIFNYFSISSDQKVAGLNAAYEFVKKYPTPGERSEQYLSVIDDVFLKSGFGSNG